MHAIYPASTINNRPSTPASYAMTDKPARQRITACHLGRIDYLPAWELQKMIQARLIDAKRSDPPHVLPHVMLMVEHPPVYTLGKSGDADHLLIDDEQLHLRGAAFHRIDRGGDITYHGPGQLVGYPILDLDRYFTDVNRYLRELEEVFIRTCADYGIEGRRIERRTGVWVGPDQRGPERKICALGIRCSRWVTLHGYALNINTDLDFFSYIIPCGISDRGVTSLASEIGRPVDEAEVRSRVLHYFSRQFESDLTLLDGAAAQTFLKSYLAQDVDIHA
jgi:lipoyl(octanoyl) transferase